MPEQAKYDIKYLENYIVLTALLTGEKLKELTVTPDFYTFYVQDAQRNAEALGLNPGFKDGQPSFMGVKLILA